MTQMWKNRRLSVWPVGERFFLPPHPNCSMFVLLVAHWHTQTIVQHISGHYILSAAHHIWKILYYEYPFIYRVCLQVTTRLRIKSTLKLTSVINREASSCDGWASGVKAVSIVIRDWNLKRNIQIILQSIALITHKSWQIMGNNYK